MAYWLLFLGLVLSTALQADDSQWLGLDSPGHTVGLRLGQDNDDGQVVGVDAALTLPHYHLLTVGVSRSGSSDSDAIEFNSYFIALATDPLARWSGQLSYQLSGDDKVLETEDVELSGQYRWSNWALRLGYIDGQVTSGVNARLLRLGLLAVPNVSVDRQGYRAGVEYVGEAWRTGWSVQQFDYKRDLQAVQGNRRLQALLGEQTLTQMFTLSDWKTDLNVYRRWQATELGLGLIRYKAIIGGDIDNTVYASLEQSLNASFGVALLVARSSADSLGYAELSLYYSW